MNRREIINSFKREPELSLRLQNAFGHNNIYFSRNYGLFNLCFPDTVPQGWLRILNLFVLYYKCLIPKKKVLIVFDDLTSHVERKQENEVSLCVCVCVWLDFVTSYLLRGYFLQVTNNKIKPPKVNTNKSNCWNNRFSLAENQKNGQFSDVGSFSKMGSPCIWSNEFMVPESKKEHFSNNELYRHYAAKATIIAYVVGELLYKGTYRPDLKFYSFKLWWVKSSKN